MKRRKFRLFVAFLLVFSLLSGCAARQEEEEESTSRRKRSKDKVEDVVELPSEEESAEGSSQESGQEPEAVPDLTISRISKLERPLLIRAEGRDPYSAQTTASVEAYTIEPDLSNIDNLWQYYLYDEEKEKLSQYGFFVGGSYGSEFFEVYEDNRYLMYPSFVTVDSLMHTYHLYFSYLLKNVERDRLSEDVAALSEKMLEKSMSQYEELKGSEWESAATRNVAFFAVGARLLDAGTKVPAYAEDIVRDEMDKISLAEGIALSEITGGYEDYTQYIPRGYYEGDEKLEAYFRAMMWYGRISFVQDDEDLDRSALLITAALTEDAEVYGLWEGIYAVTSFFAGASDDFGVCEYGTLAQQVYGEDFSLADLKEDALAFQLFHSMTADLPAPQINSIPIRDGENNVIPSFRFMGQRFTIDAFVMQKLIYSDIRENADGMYRMLPDVLDVPAALGSDVALEILEEAGATEYEGYSDNMDLLRKYLAADNVTLWSASLYANWLNTLRPLLEEKGEGYPMFMQNKEWSRKNLECFAGSFAELKHDTILYSKQVIAEMGGGYEEEPDYRGYVEPEPLVYSRFVTLSERTAQGLKEYGMLSEEDEENLSRLTYIAKVLLTISEKELRDEVLSEDEYEFIKAYGGNIEHFWYETVKNESDSEWISSADFPAAIVADIATDPNGQVLEVATGNPSVIYVAVKFDGKIRIARGSVYSFYQFPWPLNDRLTDSSWRQMMGYELNDEGYYNYEEKIDRPEWTESYRYEYRYW